MSSSSIVQDLKFSNKKEFIYCISLLNDLGYYDDMVDLIKSSNVEKYDVNYEESQLIGSAFKNALNVKRKEKTVVDSIYADENVEGEEKECAQLLREQVCKEMRAIGKTTYIIIRTKCIPRTTDDKILMYYWHLMGDIMRYCADTFDGSAKKKLHKKSLQAYSFALELANKLKLPPSNPTMLEIMVNLSVLHRDMNEDLDFAIQMAAEAFRDAIKNMHHLDNDDDYSKTIGILGLLKDNIHNWCEISGRQNVDALFDINAGENFDHFKNIMNSIHS